MIAGVLEITGAAIVVGALAQVGLGLSGTVRAQLRRGWQGLRDIRKRDRGFREYIDGLHRERSIVA